MSDVAYRSKAYVSPKKIKNNNKTLYTNILTDWNKNNYLWIRIKLKVQQNGVNVNLTDILISVMQ